eukprot:NODE_275_length_12088_cov_0.250813.p4 type:complete len:351 gc:universal NODE_275_length_12088_cov_0.250813:11126-10074(-)
MKRHQYDFASESEEENEIELHKYKEPKNHAIAAPLTLKKPVFSKHKSEPVSLLSGYKSNLPEVQNIPSVLEKQDKQIFTTPGSKSQNDITTRWLPAASRRVNPPIKLSTCGTSTSTEECTSESSSESEVDAPSLEFIPKEERQQSVAEPSVPIVANKSELIEDDFEYIVHHNKVEKSSKMNSFSSDKYQILAIDDQDDENPEEYDKWKIRELSRLIRNKQESMAYELLIQEVDQFRSLPESERNELHAQKIKQQQEQLESKTKYTFLQKYYHKGAFYQDSDAAILNRDYDVATGDDAVDKSDLPDILKVKNFGKRGKSKWTHLSNEDTLKDKEAWGDEAVYSMIVKKQKL